MIKIFLAEYTTIYTTEHFEKHGKTRNQRKKQVSRISDKKKKNLTIVSSKSMKEDYYSHFFNVKNINLR